MRKASSKFRMNESILEGLDIPILSRRVYVLDFTNRDIRLVYSLN